MKAATVIAASIVTTMLGHAADAVAQPPKEAGQCFFTRDIQNILAPDDHTIYLRVRNHTFYRIDTIGECPELPFNDGHISLQAVTGGPTVCRAIDLDLRVSSHGVSTPCLIKSLHQLTPDEAAALPKADRP